MLKNFFKVDKTTPVDALIDALQERMHNTDVLSENYAELTARLERLYKIKANERRDPVSRETMAIIAGNLLGILVIVAYEQKHVMTSKGFTQIIKPKQDGMTT